MAQMNISVPDDLRERMSEHSASMNWSQIAAQAFAQAIDSREGTQGNASPTNHCLQCDLTFRIDGEQSAKVVFNTADYRLAIEGALYPSEVGLIHSLIALVKGTKRWKAVS